MNKVLMDYKLNAEWIHFSMEIKTTKGNYIGKLKLPKSYEAYPQEHNLGSRRW